MKNPEGERAYMGPFFHLIGVADAGMERDRTDFPLLCSCMECHGIRDFYLGNEPAEVWLMSPADRKELAFQISLIQHGYYLAQWGTGNIMNKYIFPKKCSCECDHAWSEIDQPGRCLHTYQCAKCKVVRTVDSSD